MRFTRLLVLTLLAFPSLLLAQLQPDQIVLIVNRNSPDSVALADYYATARHVPKEQIVALDLPIVEELSFEQYERDVVPQIRHWLTERKLDRRIACFVTFYGVPLKIAARKNGPDESRELENLRDALRDAQQQLAQQTLDFERQARAADPSFEPRTGETIDALNRRLDHASQSLALATQRIGDVEQRRAKTSELMTAIQKLRRPVSTEKSDPPATQPTTAPATVPISQDDLAERRFDPQARRQVRALGANDGLVSFARVLAAQVDYLTPENSDASFDNELALVLWPNYPRQGWLPNPLSYRYLESRVPHTFMVMRLDAAEPQKVRDMIATAIQVERNGMKGRVLIDAGGAQKLDPGGKNPGFQTFEKTFEQLALLLKQRTKLQVSYDMSPDVLPAHSVKDVALYTGWYSVQNYIPSADLVPGAIGYHVASFELTSLRDGNGWCKGLLKDGAIATLGPVSEPYLHAFPLPNDFFPLLLTGQMSLAEVYWRTTPLTSWKMCMIGDPLYTPYRKEPAMRASDLPEHLRGLLSPLPGGEGQGEGRSAPSQRPVR